MTHTNGVSPLEEETMLTVIDHLVALIGESSRIGTVEDVCALLLAAAQGLERLARKAGREFDSEYCKSQITSIEVDLLSILTDRLT